MQQPGGERNHQGLTASRMPFKTMQAAGMRDMHASHEETYLILRVCDGEVASRERPAIGQEDPLSQMIGCSSEAQLIPRCNPSMVGGAYIARVDVIAARDPAIYRLGVVFGQIIPKLYLAFYTLKRYLVSCRECNLLYLAALRSVSRAWCGRLDGVNPS